MRGVWRKNGGSVFQQEPEHGHNPGHRGHNAGHCSDHLPDEGGGKIIGAMKVNISAFMKTPPLPPGLGQPRKDPATKPVYLEVTKCEDSSMIIKQWGDRIPAGFLVDILRALPRSNEDLQRVEAFVADLYAYKKPSPLTDCELDEGLIMALINKSQR